MRRRMLLPLLAGVAVLATGCEEELLSAAPADAAAQQASADSDRMGGPGRRGMVPLGRLLAQREALGLTAEQVARLETLAAEMRERNEALRAQLREGMGSRPELTDEQREAMRAQRGARRGERPQLTEEQREAMRARSEALRPLMEELAASQRAAMEEVREILTDEQEAKLRELRPEGARGMGGPGGEGRRGGGPGRGGWRG